LKRNECWCCFAVNIKTNQHFSQKLLLPFDKLSHVVLVKDEGLSEYWITQTTCGLWREHRVGGDHFQIRLYISAKFDRL
jgi:hypothetical protein